MLANDASLACPLQYQLEEFPLFNLEAIEGHPMVFVYAFHVLASAPYANTIGKVY